MGGDVDNRKKERKNSCQSSDENEKEISSSSHGIMASISDRSETRAEVGRPCVRSFSTGEADGWLVHVAEVLENFGSGGGASPVPIQLDAPSHVEACAKAAERWISDLEVRDKRR